MTSANTKRWFLFLLTGCAMLLASCASPPAPRSKALVDGERHLQQGTAAFYNDQYPAAAASFNQALHIFQSIDHQPGIIDSYINLIETSMVLNNLPLAQQRLKEAESLIEHSPSNLLSTRIRLLWVRLYYKIPDYQSALTTLQPLLPEFDANNRALEKNRHTLNIITSQARLSVKLQRQDAELWLSRLQTAITLDAANADRYQALLFRLQASRRQQTDNLDESMSLLEQALTIYHQLNYRRGIAACLQQMADVEIQRNNWSQANQLLQRALPVLTWTLNHQGLMLSLEKLITINEQLQNSPAQEHYSEQLNRLKSRSALHNTL